MLDDLRDYCKSFKGFSEDIKWDHLCFCVAEKIFAIFSVDEIPLGAAFKVSAEDFETLTELDGFKQAPHFAKGQWISVNNIALLGKKEWEHYLNASYNLVKAKLTKKQQAALS